MFYILSGSNLNIIILPDLKKNHPGHANFIQTIPRFRITVTTSDNSGANTCLCRYKTYGSEKIGKYGAWTDRREKSKRIRQGRRITVPVSLFNSCCSHFLLPDLCQLIPKYSPAEVKEKKMAAAGK